MTQLDDAYAAMVAATDDDSARLRYYARLADDEMVLLLTEEAVGGKLAPRVFDLEDGPVVLMFDSEEKLAGFAAGAVPYAALPGRVIAQQLAGQGIGLAVNMGAASMMLFPPDAVDWLAGTLDTVPDTTEARPTGFHAPAGFPAQLWAALERKLVNAARLTSGAIVAGVVYEGGGRGHVVAFLDTAAGAESDLARAVSEALIFSGIDAGELDVTFLDTGDPGAALIGRVGKRLDLAHQDGPTSSAPRAPGMDPLKPPVLR
jgi:SseB protein N-terminal domain